MRLRIEDLRSLPASSSFEADLCIVGSGPAGLTIATELANGKGNILIVESGGTLGEHPFTAALNEIESTGAPRVLDQAKVRNRILGGSTHTWSGRCAPFDPIDYEARPWVPNSGWPLRPADVEPFYSRTAEYLGLVPIDYSGPLAEELALEHRIAGSGSPELRPVFWQFSRTSARAGYVRFGPRFQKLEASNIRVLTHATATELRLSADGDQVQSMELADPDGRRFTLSSRRFVLSGGGIENARLLLASRSVDTRGVGNKEGLVGRFFMDHPRTTIGTFAPEAVPALDREFLPLRHPSGARMQQGFSLTPEAQRKEQMLNCAAWLTLHVADDDLWRALGGLRRDKGRARLRHGRVVVRNAHRAIPDVWNKVWRGRALPRRFKRLDLDALVEQTPDRDSRITLSDRRDPLGVPLSRIDWKLGESERQSIIRLGHAVHDTLQAAGLPTPTLTDWVRERRPENAVFHDPAHPMGATRMADCACHGVVDRDCKVFGVDNLFVGGSSVFPTGSHANPTFMIVALALRLADKLCSA